MKLAFATIAATVIAASSASAMITMHDRAFDAQLKAGEITSSGTVSTVAVPTAPSGPNIDWNSDGVKTVTVFDAGLTDAHATGYNAR